MNYSEAVSKIYVLLIVDFTTKISNNKWASQKGTILLQKN